MTSRAAPFLCPRPRGLMGQGRRGLFSPFKSRVMDSSGQKVVVIGAGEFAEIAYEYFTHDTPHEVAAFSVERAFVKQDNLFGLPIVAFEELPLHYPPDRFAVFVAVTYTKLNRVRARLFNAAKRKGYRAI